MSGRVEVVTVDGVRGSVDAKDVPAMVAAGGTVLSKEQVATEQANKNSVTGSGAVDAFVTKADPLGIGKFVGKNLGESMYGSQAAQSAEEQIRQAQEANPTASAAGSLAEFGLVSAATMGFGGAGAAAGRFAGRALSGLGTESALARALVTGTKLATQSGVEQALFDGLKSTSEGLLGDKDLTAEKVLADMGNGMLLGIGGGFALGAGGSLLASGARGLASGVSSGLSRLLPQAEEVTAAAVGRAEGAATRLETTAAKAEGGLLSEVQNDAAFRSMGTTRKVVTSVAKNLKMEPEQAAQKLGAWLVDNGAVSAGDDAINVLERVKELKASAGARIGSTVERAGGRIRVIADPLDGATNSNLAKTIGGRTLQDEAQELIKASGKKVETLAHGKEFAKDFENFVQALENNGSISADGTASLSDALEQRRSLGKLAYDSGSGIKSEVMQKFERTIEDRIEKTIKEVAGNDLHAEYMAAKSDWRLAKLAEGAAEYGSAGIQGNNKLGLRNSVLGAALTATSGPLAGIPAALGLQLIQQRGMSTLAAAAGNVSRAGTVKGIVQTLDQLVERAAKGVVSPAKAVGLKAPNINVSKVVSAIEGARANPAAYLERVRKQADLLRKASPELAESFQGAAIRASTFLASKIPPEMPKSDLLSSKPGAMSPIQERRFAHYVHAVNDPKQVMEEFAAGKVVPEKIEALRAVYPSMFRQLQVQVLTNIAQAEASGKPVQYTQRIRLGLILDAPTDISLTQEGVAYRQNLYQIAQNPKPSSAQAPSANSRPITVSVAKSTYDRIEGG